MFNISGAYAQIVFGNVSDHFSLLGNFSHEAFSGIFGIRVWDLILKIWDWNLFRKSGIGIHL